MWKAKILVSTVVVTYLFTFLSMISFLSITLLEEKEYNWNMYCTFIYLYCTKTKNTVKKQNCFFLFTNVHTSSFHNKGYTFPDHEHRKLNYCH